MFFFSLVFDGVCFLKTNCCRHLRLVMKSGLRAVCSLQPEARTVYSRTAVVKIGRRSISFTSRLRAVSSLGEVAGHLS